MELESEIKDFIVKGKNKFSIFWVDNFDESFGLVGVVDDEEGAQIVADVATTNARWYNDFEDDGETLLLGTTYYVYNQKGEKIYTGQIKEIFLH